MNLNRPAAYLTALAALGLLTATMSGCASKTTADAGSAGTSPSGTPTSLNTSDPITAQRAQYVTTMLSNSYTAGPETESGIMSVITGYGGGYVTDASLSGAPGPKQTLTLAVVLGGGKVLNGMQGETDMNSSGIACFTYTVGYYDYTGSENKATCPSSLTTPSADATAARQIAEEATSAHYDTQTPSNSIPSTLAAAKQAIGLGSPESATATAGLTAADFATGTDAVQHKPDAALALPQVGGGCIYVVYRWIRKSRAGGGTSGSADTATANSWAAPTDAACTGAAALGAGAFLTVDRYAGG